MSARHLTIVGVAWVAGGVVAAVLMRRRGHDFGLRLALGMILGPLIVLLAVPVYVGPSTDVRSDSIRVGVIMELGT